MSCCVVETIDELSGLKSGSRFCPDFSKLFTTSVKANKGKKWTKFEAVDMYGFFWGDGKFQKMNKNVRVRG